jgi:uncharacterized RDD family membrane protein YckC
MSTPAPGPVQPTFVPSFGGYAGQPGAIPGIGFWRRVGARLIDLVVHYVVSFCATLCFAFLVGLAAAMAHRPPGSLAPTLGHLTVSGFVFGLLGSVAYHTICEGIHGSTVGKLALSMVVLQEDGSPCRVWPAAIRSLGYFVDALFFGVIGYFAMQKSPQQQRHGDTWAHTVVCKRSDAAQGRLRSGGMFVATLVMAALVDAALIIAGLLLDLI